MQDISNDLWIIGVIAAAALVLSAVMAIIYFLFSLCGGAGSHICCAAVPVGYGPSHPVLWFCKVQVGLHLMQAGIAYLGAWALSLLSDTAMNLQLHQLSSPMPHVSHTKLNSTFIVACHAADVPFYTALPSLGPCLWFSAIMKIFISRRRHAERDCT